MILLSDNIDDLQYLIEEVSHESQENRTEGKAKQKKDHSQLISVGGKLKEQVTVQF